ncbi:hypothetical protein [Clostridium weizhouense]|uniref:Uncharacterized protein n=1 Tax=Clostridium weizhouense TaxID=2859781 RepID=A0ABS7AUW4_9CLOT|nr:hypothetical protein [Clostridium weizhouense]MBW6411691.1 hypothetical protein [Clostridium weizhouense]
MFIDEKVIKENNGAKVIDKFAMNQVILKAGFVGAQCSAEKLGIQKCENCEMESLCEEMDNIYDAVKTSTVVVKKVFNL